MRERVGGQHDGAAAEPLDRAVSGSKWDDERGGVVVELDPGPELRFGDGSDAEAKWRAVAAVLADPKLGAPLYIDVSIPERPVTG